MSWYLKVVRDNYANFSGRAQRAEFWWFVLVNLIILILAMIADNLSGLAFEYVDPFTGVAVSMGYGWIYTIYALATFLPALAVSVRRLHDTDRSGWLLLLNLVPCVGIILLVWYCGDSTPGDNQYGPNPKGIGGPAPAADEPTEKTSDDSETGKAEGEA